MSMNTPMPDEEKVREALREVMDPEVNMNIVDLGLVYGVKITGDKLQVDLTMTTQACPMGEMILDEARYALKEIVPDGAEIALNLVWEPPWVPAMMTEHARKYFGWTDEK